jgi:pSer/pThr/pTyr-binding forkhead associated (FHA) protein
MEANVPRLIFLSSAGHMGRSVDLTGEYMTVGRSASNNIVLDDPAVSRVHASLKRQGNDVFVQDMHSSSGTTVNGRPVTGPLRLQAGDVVVFGPVRLEYENGNRESDATIPMPTQKAAPSQAPNAATSHVRYDIEGQHAGTISNVAGNQYTAYVRQVRQERESFLREVAATRTKARWIIWTGVVLSVAGLTLFAGSIIRFMTYIIDMMRQGPDGSIPTLPEDVLNPVVFVGWAMGAAGTILIVIGIVLHVVATSRRKRVDRELPLPRPAAD